MSAVSVTRPVIVFESAVFRIAPTSALETVTPSPATDNGSATVIPPDKASVALLATVVPVDEFPSADALEIATTPAEIVVAPVYVLVADNVNVPVPDFVN